jgi:metal-dependent amidase/aminoacylase/carboxypeptidase family protein
LHKTPEISGEEKRTSSIIIEELEKTQPDKLYKNIGGFGVIAVYDSGKTVPGRDVACGTGCFTDL